MNRKTAGLLVGVCAGAAMMMTTGCGLLGYSLGTTLPPGIRTIHVPTFANSSGEPQIEADTTRATIQELQKDGTLRVVSAEAADVVLTVNVSRFTLQPIRYEDDRAKTTSEYRLRITAYLVLTRRDNGEQLVDRWVQGETTFQPGGDLASAKIAAIPAAAADLAHDIVESVVEYW